MATISRLPVLGLLSIAIAMQARGGSEQPPVNRDPKASVIESTKPSPRDQYDFLIGDWTVAVTLRRPNAPDLNYAAEWHNHWLPNALVVIQEWKDPYASGLEVRSYSPKLQHWVGRNIYMPEPGIWYDNIAKLVHGEMIVTTHQDNGGAGETITREIYHDMKPDHFAIRTEASSDGGKTWQPGRYSAIMTRK